MIPATLTARPQWCTWKLEPDPEKPDKPKKVCKNPRTGGNAQSNNPQTWTSYAEAVKAAEARNHAGVGFFFDNDDGLVGIDLDGCLDPQTGAVAPWARGWLQRLCAAGYCEISPSGQGVKVIVRGTILRSRKLGLGPHEGIEVYARRGRWFAITGLRFEGGQEEPGDAQPVLDDLMAWIERQRRPEPAPASDDSPATYVPREIDEARPGDWRDVRRRGAEVTIREWVARKVAYAQGQMRATPDGQRHNRRFDLGRLLGGVIASAPRYLSEREAFDILYDAQRPDGHDAQERTAIADGITEGMRSPLALPAFATDHDPIADEAGRACCPACDTRLRPSKYDYPGTTQPGYYCPRCKFPMVWPAEIADLFSGEESEPQPAAEGEIERDDEERLPLLLPAGQLGAIPPATPLIPDLIYLKKLHLLFGAPGSGKSFVTLDMVLTVAQHYPVVYVAAEAIEDYEARVNAWKAHHGADVSNAYFWRQPLQLSNDAEVDRFIAATKPLRPALVVVDPLADCMVGLVESTQEGMSVALFNLNRIRRETRAGVVIVHHSGWNDERERGSSILRGAARVVIKVEMREDGLLMVSCVKKNHGAKFDPRRFRLIPAGDEGGAVPVPASQVMSTGRVKLTDKLIRVLEALTTEPLRDGASHTQLVNDTQYPAATVNRLLTTLVDHRFVEVDDRGRTKNYKLTQEGVWALDEAERATGKQVEERGRKSGVSSTASFNWFVCSSTSVPDSSAVLPPSSTVLPPSGSLLPLLSPPLGGESGRAPEMEERNRGMYTAIPGYDDEPLDTPDEPNTAAAALAERLRQRRNGHG